MPRSEETEVQEEVEVPKDEEETKEEDTREAIESPDRRSKAREQLRSVIGLQSIIRKR